jgi:hypothetical protein
MMNDAASLAGEPVRAVLVGTGSIARAHVEAVRANARYYRSVNGHVPGAP